MPKLAGGMTIACLALAAVNDRCGVLEVLAVKSYGETLQEFEYDKLYQQWSPVSRVAVFAPEKIGPHEEIMKITNDAAAPTRLWRFDGDFEQLKHLKNDPRQAAHHLKSDAQVLVIGSGGGADVLTALAFGQRQITAVEINPVIAQLVTGRYADYIGRIFEDPRVTLHVQDGRSFVAGSREAYDVIQITMIDSWSGAAAGAYIFNENSLYTLEAVADYCNHLRPEGILSITRYYDWDEALRLTNMLVEHLARQNITDVHERLMVLLENRTHGRRATVLLKNGRFTPAEVHGAERLVQQTDATLLYAPYRSPLGDSSEAEHFRTLIAGSAAQRHSLVQNYRANLAPPTDDCPFFFYMARPADALRRDPNDHASRRAAIPMLYGTLGACLLVSLLAALVPLASPAASAFGTRQPARGWFLTYFACLGAGYMLIEIAMVQRLTLLLGHPTYSFVVVLSTLLLASGLGSLCSRGRSPVSVFFAVVVLLTLLLAVYDWLAAALWLALPWRIALTVALLSPPALLMGMCFPLGIELVRSRDARLVPWCWGVNGAFSVLATTAALVLTLHLGLKFTIGAGLACYMLAGLAVSRMARAPAIEPIITLQRAALHGPAVRQRWATPVAILMAILAAGGLLYVRQHERTRFSRAQAEHMIIDAGGKLHRTAGGEVHQIDLAGVRLDDAAWERLEVQLAQFSGELTRLNLAGAAVSDARVLRLSRLQALQELDLSGTQVTDDGIAGLQAALPHCALRR
jgi:predicted membrane-bound spermidine synthase